MIEVENLVKRFGDFTALNEISFHAEEGEILGFLGPNGAGKTTTMRILTGYMPPTAGKATIAGFDVFAESLSVRHQIGYLPETVPLYPDMTVRGYIEFIAELRQVADRRQRAMEVLEMVGMHKRARSLIRTISKGMRQRVGLAQALVHNPAVLILDEPTIGLDPSQVADLRELIRQLGDQHTILFSTHILSEAEQICDRVVIINQGTIRAVGAPDELRDKLQMNRRVLVRVVDNPKKLLKPLRNIAGVTSVSLQADDIIIDARKEVRPSIMKAVHDSELELLELRPLALTLEEVFLQYTGGETVV